jgi:Cyclic nucleotide-binding domain/Major Facilitator Superfamily/HEAT repeats
MRKSLSYQIFQFFRRAKLRRIIPFLGLAASVMALNVFAYTLASSLFITHAGADGLPVSYIAIGLVALPLYTWFSQVVDRYKHTRIFQVLLVGGMLFSVVLRDAIALDTLPVYYIIYIVFYFQWTLHLDVLFPSLISDYFTSRDYNRNIPYLTMAQGIGGLLGGGITSIASSYFSTQNLFLILPIFYAVVIAQLIYIDRVEDPLDTGRIPAAKNNSIFENIKVLPLLWKRYPIIGFLLAGIVLWITLYSLAEFQYYQIYEETFQGNARELTKFLGLFRAGNDILQLLILYFVTRPLIARWGVVRMNLLYPLTTLLGFLSLALRITFPSAVFLNFNNAALETAVNQPAYTLNYNAIPQNFMGRVRSLVDGIFYSLGLALSGVLLLISQSFLTPVQTISIGVFLSVIFLGVRYAIGQTYLESLISMLKTGSARWDEVNEGLTQLPDTYRSQIRQLLQSDHRQSQILGLELAARIERPSQFITDIENLPFEEDSKLYREVVTLFSTVKDRGIQAYLRYQLNDRRETLRSIALESLIASKQLLSDTELRALLAKANPNLQILACIAAENAETTDPQIRELCQKVWQLPMDDTIQRLVVRGISSTGNSKLIPILRELLIPASAEVKREGLNALAALKPLGNESLAELATPELDHPDPAVRLAAIELLGAIRSDRFLDEVARGLTDFDLNVRLQSAKAIAKYGELGLSKTAPLLDSSRPELVETAMISIAQVRTHRAENLLWQHLQSDYEQVSNLVRWQRQIPAQALEWQALRTVLRDYSQRLIYKVLYVLSWLGHERTVRYVDQMLSAEDVRRQANAVEALVSLKHRRFVLPILPLLEASEDDSSLVQTIDLHRLLREMLKARDRWIRIGAILTFVAQGESAKIKEYCLTCDRNSLVQQLAIEAVESPESVLALEAQIKRVLFLKTAPLLNYLSLDELLPINRAFVIEKFSAGDRICMEGAINAKLYVVYRGRVCFSRGEGNQKQVLSRLEEGDSFGENSLFKNDPNSGSVTADSDCILLSLSRSSFDILADLYPKLLTCFQYAGISMS